MSSKVDSRGGNHNGTRLIFWESNTLSDWSCAVILRFLMSSVGGPLANLNSLARLIFDSHNHCFSHPLWSSPTHQPPGFSDCESSRYTDTWVSPVCSKKWWQNCLKLHASGVLDIVRLASQHPEPWNLCTGVFAAFVCRVWRHCSLAWVRKAEYVIDILGKALL